MHELVDSLAEALGKSRPLTAQTYRHLGAAYGLGRDEVSAFLLGRLTELPEDEQDLILSPLFTPKLADQARFAALLGGRSVGPESWPGIIEALLQRPVRAALTAEDGTVLEFDLPRVGVERYVNRLRLDGKATPERVAAVEGAFSGEDRNVVLAVVRRAVWFPGDRASILDHFLARATETQATAQDATRLMELVESYEPENLAELRERLPRWQEILRQQIDQGEQPKPFFNEQVAELHGGGRDQRASATDLITRQSAELAGLQRLQRILAA